MRMKTWWIIATMQFAVLSCSEDLSTQNVDNQPMQQMQPITSVKVASSKIIEESSPRDMQKSKSPENEIQFISIVPVIKDDCEGEDEGKSEGTREFLTLHAMSFNVRWYQLDTGTINSWDNRRQSVINLIKKQGPDVVGLQEPALFQTKDIESGLDHYSAYTYLPERGGNTPILYNSSKYVLDAGGSFWLSQRSPYPGGNRACTWIRIMEKNSGQGIYVYNVHYFSKPNEDQNRIDSSNSLVRAIASRKFSDPFVIVGDFNSVPTSTAINTLTNSKTIQINHVLSQPPFIDTYRKLNPLSPTEGTASGFSGGTMGNRVDYIFAPRSAKILTASILRDNINGVYPSDHFPIDAKIQITMSVGKTKALLRQTETCRKPDQLSTIREINRKIKF